MSVWLSSFPDEATRSEPRDQAIGPCSSLMSGDLAEKVAGVRIDDFQQVLAAHEELIAAMEPKWHEPRDQSHH